MTLPEPQPDATALVTGASSGIGAEIARELARRGHGVTLVARREDRLRALASELSTRYGVRAGALACDLAEPGERDRLPERVAELGLRVDVLVNNAGFGTGGPFHRSPVEQEVRQVRLLCEAVVALCGHFVPGMAERRSGAVLIVASTAGMQPLPYSAGYSAAKAHALTFAEALHEELRPRGVTVTALCPGPVETEFFEVSQGHPVEGSMPRFTWVGAPDVAREGVEALAAGRRVVVPGIAIRAATTVGRYVPHMVQLPLIARVFRRREASGPAARPS